MDESLQLSEAKSKLSELVRLTGAGVSTTITVSGRPVARLVPHRGNTERLGSGHGWFLVEQNLQVDLDTLPRPFLDGDDGAKEVKKTWTKGQFEAGILWRNQTDSGAALLAVPDGRWNSQVASYHFFYRWPAGEIVRLTSWVGKFWSRDADGMGEARLLATEMGNAALGIAR